MRSVIYSWPESCHLQPPAVKFLINFINTVTYWPWSWSYDVSDSTPHHWSLTINTEPSVCCSVDDVNGLASLDPHQQALKLAARYLESLLFWSAFNTYNAFCRWTLIASVVTPARQVKWQRLLRSAKKKSSNGRYDRDEVWHGSIIAHKNTVIPQHHISQIIQI